MADRRKNRRKNDKSDDANKCTKEEYAVAKHLRFNVPIKDAKFVAMGEDVQSFIAKDAVDALLDSKWAKKSTGDVQITDRKSCVALMNYFLQKGLFHRAVKVERKKDKSDKAKKKKKEAEAVEEDKKSKKDKKKAITDGQESETKTEDGKKEKKDDEKKDEKKEEKEKKKKERKLKLNMHDEQVFLDGEHIYVWIYDPIPAKTFLIGLLMVIGAVGFCLFPLWPDEMRIGVYYLSLVGASFVGFVLFLVVLKQILFGVVWVLTMGKIHLWIFPNLTEDVGVIESFKPFYEIKRPSDTKKAKDVKKEIRKRREKALENEETESETQEMDGEKNEEQEFEMVSHADITENGAQEEEKDHEGDDEDVGDEDDDNVKDNESGNNSSEEKKNK